MNDYSSFIGKVLDKRYKILEVVGIGGMSVVLRAEDLLMNRIVAIKILNDEYNGNEEAENRFIDESKAIAMLSHKNIRSIYDVAIYPDIKYIVMEYIDGITLRDYLDNKGALPWNEACIYILQVLRALEHAHSKGVIHRDIKPQNIILQKNGDIKVMDFGIAKIPTSTDDKSNEKAVGTVYYISPEQASGKETGAYSDLYSAGIMLYEAVTGQLPFTADSPAAVAAMQINNEPQNPRDIVLDIPVGVSQIILKAMMKAPEDRFRSAHTMAKAIEWVIRNPDVIFSLSGEEPQNIGDTSVVSIDMIDTTEIKPIDEEEITSSLGIDTTINKPDGKDDGKKKKKRKKGKHSGTMFPIILGIAIPFLIVSITLAILLGVTFMKNMGFTDSVIWDMQPFKTMYKIYTAFVDDDGFGNQTVDDEATFPNLIGKKYNAELVSQLRNGTYGRTFEIAENGIMYTTNNSYEDGQIIYTEPSAEAIRKGIKKDGATVFMFTSILVNRLETSSVIPNVIGLSKSDARVMLANKYNIPLSSIEFEPETNPEYNMMYDGQVTRTVPAAGEVYEKGDVITVFICTREEPVVTGAMPNTVGLDANYAIRLCTYVRYGVELVEFPVIGGDNTIMEQSIPAGTVSDKGTKVILTVRRPMSSMPYLYHTNLTQAAQLLDQMGIPFTYEIYDGLFKEDSSIFTFQTDPQVQRERIALLGGYRTDMLTEETFVIFQSVASGDAPTVDEPVLLIGANPCHDFD